MKEAVIVFLLDIRVKILRVPFTEEKSVTNTDNQFLNLTYIENMIPTVEGRSFI
jgi:hypothetical protein